MCSQLLFKYVIQLLLKSPRIQKSSTPCALSSSAVGDFVLGNYTTGSLQAYYGFTWICTTHKQPAAFRKDLAQHFSNWTSKLHSPSVTAFKELQTGSCVVLHSTTLPPTFVGVKSSLPVQATWWATGGIQHQCWVRASQFGEEQALRQAEPDGAHLSEHNAG